MVLVVALRTAPRQQFGRSADDAVDEDLVAPGMGTNVRSVADSLGLAKETVRRKVAELIETGWVIRRAGRLFLTSKAFHDLDPVRENIEHLAVRCYNLLSAAP